MSNEMILMKSSFFTNREAKRESLKTNATFMDSIVKEKADDLEAQYKRVFSVKGNIAQINIVGPLSQDGPDWMDVYLGYGGTAYKNIIRAANEAKALYESGDIESVIARMNTPGGTVDGCDHAYLALKEIGSIGVAKNDGMIASAGVWLASAFETIEPTTDTALIGSIGVVCTYTDYAGYYDNFGIKVIDITNKESTNKRPDVTTQEGFEVIQRELDDLYNVFVSRVTTSRPVTRKQIDSLKGEMLIASKAVDFGLMDQPQNEDTQNNVDDVNKNKEMEVSILEGTQKLEVITENVITEDDLKESVSAERERIYGLAKISGISITDELKKAIDEGTDVGAYAVKQVEAKEAKEAAEIKAAKELREAKGNEDQTITGIKSSDEAKAEEAKSLDKLDAILDKNFEKKGGKK